VKTAISIPDAIFAEAERLAKLRGWSRSELYANAVSAYVDSERFLGVREKLNAVYGQNVDDSAVDPRLAKAQARSLPEDKWERAAERSGGHPWKSLEAPGRDSEGRY
jgi:hypothetical protein